MSRQDDAVPFTMDKTGKGRDPYHQIWLGNDGDTRIRQGFGPLGLSEGSKR